MEAVLLCSVNGADFAMAMSLPFMDAWIISMHSIYLYTDEPHESPNGSPAAVLSHKVYGQCSSHHLSTTDCMTSMCMVIACTSASD